MLHLLERREKKTILRAEGFQAPSWASIAAGARPAQNSDDELMDGLGDPVRGWQRDASEARDAVERDDLLSDLDPPSRALMLSQAGPMAARALTAIPTTPEFTIPQQHFRVLLLRRLRLPLPFTAVRCRCGTVLDALGDHITACSRAGVLRSRAIPLEVAMARVCREARARVATNVFLRDRNLDIPVTDARQG